jgi:osmoprotectant transport system substrate-binding protein
MPSLRSPAAIAALVTCLALSSCGGGDSGGAPADSGGAPISPGQKSRTVTVSLAYTRSSEQRLLTQIYAQALKAAGFRVKLARGLEAGAPAVAALERGRASAYARFTRVGAAEQRLLESRGVGVLGPGPPVRSSGLAVPARTARRFRLKEISGLRNVAARMTLAVPRGCERDRQCLPALERVYGLDFRRVRRVRPELVHEALRTNRSQVSLVSTTDPHVRRSGETLLEDDRRAFPAAGPVVLVGKALERRGGRALREAVDKADSGLTVEIVEELNARVAFDEKSPARVALEYLRATGLVPGAG